MSILYLLFTTRGADFRRAFSKLGGLRAVTNLPFMALIATAPPHVEAELISSLHMHDPVIVRQPLDRPNIYLSASRSVGMKVRTYIHGVRFFHTMFCAA